MTNDEKSCARVRRSAAGLIGLMRRDVAGLCLVAEQYAAPYDLLGAALGARRARLRALPGARPRPRVVLAGPGRHGPRLPAGPRMTGLYLAAAVLALLSGL